ncbi:MAG: hypothetical protein PQJ59_13985 [Spirochaetales bacterium]|nr:hypothetical protein [Spirochaetales bacterium]
MKHKERRIFQKNKIGFLLILAFIILNTVYSIYTLNSMEKDYFLGSFTMQTILLLLFGFLTAVKVQNYTNTAWCLAAVVLGAYQAVRILFVQTGAVGGQLAFLNIVLILSAGFAIAGGVLSFIWTKERQSIEKKMEQENN